MTSKYYSYKTFTLAFILTMLSFSCNEKAKHKKEKNVKNIYKAEFENTAWRTGPLLGLYPSIQKYYLTKIIPKKDKYVYGNLTSFSGETNFLSEYTASCGNDFFTTVHGKYEFFDKDKISIAVDSVTYSSGFTGWEKPTKYRNSELIYLISKDSGSMVLTKQYDNALSKWYDCILNL